MPTQNKNGTNPHNETSPVHTIGNHMSKQNTKKDVECKSLKEALCAFQNLNITATRDGSNPFFNHSKYAKLEDVINAVNHGAEFGLSFSQAIKYNVVKLLKSDGSETMVRDIYVETTIYHSNDDDIRQSLVPVLIANGANKQGVEHAKNPQSMGSGITYAKRYALQSIYGLGTDDDGNLASGNYEETKTSKEKKDYSSINNQTGGIL